MSDNSRRTPEASTGNGKALFHNHVNFFIVRTRIRLEQDISRNILRIAKRENKEVEEVIIELIRLGLMAKRKLSQA